MIVTSLRAAQDFKSIDTPIKAKKFLTAQGIPYDPSTPDKVLIGRAKARVKRLFEEDMTPEAKRAKFNTEISDAVENVLSIKDLNEITKAIVASKEDASKWYKIEYIIQDVSSYDVTVKKHSFTCSHRIYNGKCWSCGVESMGYDAYSFKLNIADTKNEDEFLGVVGAESAGSTLFKCAASRFAQMTEMDRKDSIEKIMFIPIKSGVKIQYNAKKDDLFIFVYDCEKPE